MELLSRKTEREGHAKVAGLTSRHSELAIMLRFEDLNMENLLNLQAELVYPETEYRTLSRNSQGLPDRLDSTKDWFSFANSDDEVVQVQWIKVLEIRRKMKEYSASCQLFSVSKIHGQKLMFRIDEAFAQVAFMTAKESPNPYNLRFFRTWLERPKMENFPILGPDQFVWDVDDEADLVAVHRQKGEDLLTRWFIYRVVPCFHRLVRRHFKVFLKNIFCSSTYLMTPE